MSELFNTRQARIETLKEVIQHLHRGEAPEAVKGRLRELVAEVDAEEIAAMEQQLMAEGMPAEEVRAMCDLHAEVLGTAVVHAGPAPLAPGHPIDTFQRENRALERAAAALRARLADLGGAQARADLLALLAPLLEVERHYSRKEQLVFSILERHGTTGPSKVMWGKDDEVRALLKDARTALEEPTLCEAELKVVAEAMLAPALAALEGMIFKEENILFPMARRLFTPAQWDEVWRQSPEYGWCLVEPAEGYRPQGDAAAADAQAGALAFPSGALGFETLLAMFNTLPVDLTFVDAQDRVAWFSEGPERVFARSRAVLGREVRHCHPPKSLDTVERILADFRAGRQSVAEFWLELGGRFVHIRYFALRDAAGTYLGTLEATQDLTRLRALQGQRRLLQYDEVTA